MAQPRGTSHYSDTPRLRLVGSYADLARPAARPEPIPPAQPAPGTPVTRCAYLFEALSSSADYSDAPVFGDDDAVDLHDAADTPGADHDPVQHAELRLAEPIDPAAVIRVGDALFGSTVTELFVVDRRPNAGRFMFSYELADGRFGLALATRSA